MRCHLFPTELRPLKLSKKSAQKKEKKRNLSCEITKTVVKISF